jgi:hypothetical protein
MVRSRRRRANARPTTRLFATFLAAVTVIQVGRGFAAPGDIFAIPAPVIGADPPKASPLAAGDVSVATANGSASYAYPIAVPPGRKGVAPSLALTYSSQAPMHGGPAAGWSLRGIEIIREDVSRSRLHTHDPFLEAALTSDQRKSDDRFVSSMAGESRLVPVAEPAAASDVYQTYRVAHGDVSFARHERLYDNQPARWRVRALDGSVMYFGEAGNAPGCPIGDGFAPLTRQHDAFGNEISPITTCSRTANA